jgi:hypothetical protein
MARYQFPSIAKKSLDLYMSEVDPDGRKPKHYVSGFTKIAVPSLAKR